jgi:hypothetical protein
MKPRIKITYDDLKDPKIDETISLKSPGTMMEKQKTLKRLRIYRFIRIYWLHLLIAGLIGALIVWGLLKIFGPLNFLEKKPVVNNEDEPIFVKGNNEPAVDIGTQTYRFILKSSANLAGKKT